MPSYYLIPCRLGEELGSGHFGSVQKGTWNTHEGPTDVAVKTLKPGLSERERVKFLQEAAIMGQFSHANIVQLHGVVTVGEPVSVLTIKLVRSYLYMYIVYVIIICEALRHYTMVIIILQLC